MNVRIVFIASRPGASPTTRLSIQDKTTKRMSFRRHRGRDLILQVHGAERLGEDQPMQMDGPTTMVRLRSLLALPILELQARQEVHLQLLSVSIDASKDRI